MRFIVIIMAVMPSLGLADEVERAINKAAKIHNVDPVHLRAIAIIESNMNPNVKDRINKNGTKDIGMFQINTVNWHLCAHLNLRSAEGSARCAARIIKRIKPKNLFDLAKYHSKTPKHRQKYFRLLKRTIASL